MRLNLKARDWHVWVSVILIVPILLVALTAVFLAHEHELGLKNVDITRAVAWLPGYREAPADERRTVRTSLALADGTQWIGTKAGLYQMRQGRADAVREIGHTEIRDIVAAPFGLVAAAKNGVWVQGRNGWTKTVAGDAWSANRQPDGSVVVALKDEGLMTSRDGVNWQAAPAAQQALAVVPADKTMAKRVSFANLVMDVHTGKAFLGKQAEWIWIDLVGGVMVFLGITGMLLWWRSQRRHTALLEEENRALRASLPKQPEAG